MMPGTHMGRKYLSSPSLKLQRQKPICVSSSSTSLTRPRGFFTFFATCSAVTYLRTFRPMAISAISSVTTGSSILYSGSFGVTPV